MERKMGNKIMQPAIQLMGALNYKTKFLVIFLLFLLPLGTFSFMLLKDLYAQTATTKQEIAGIAYIQALNNVLREVTDHRGRMNAFRRGDASFRDKVLLSEVAVDKAFAVLAEQDRVSGVRLKVGARSRDLQHQWAVLKRDGFNLPATATYDAHISLLADVNALIRHVAITSSLLLDPDIHSQLIALTAIYRMPPLIESVARLRGLATTVVAHQVLTPENRGVLLLRREILLTNTNALESELRIAYRANAQLKSQLAGASLAAVSSVRNFVQRVDAQLVNSEHVNATAVGFFDEGTQVLDKVWALNGAITPTLHTLFETRLEQNKIQELITSGAIAVVILAIIYLFAGFYLAMRQTLSRVDAGTQALAAGDLTARIKIHGKDEMMRIAESFNALAVTLEEKTRREHEQLAALRKAADIQDRVAKLRAHIEQVAAGDLTRRMDVSGDDDLALLGQNLNTMTENLARVAAGTQDAVNAMNTVLDEMQGAIEAQSSGAAEQAVAVNQTAASMNEIKAISTQTLDKARALGDMADQTRRESEEGLNSISQGIAGMEAIRQRMEDIARTILSLSEQTQQIGQITAVVTSLAQQSKMLALNASIEAAKAGEAGKGFAVVAAEVRELAEQSQQSTVQVQKILQDIRHATDKAVMATEEGTKGVDAGVLSVRRNGEVMRHLGDVISETTLASQQIVAAVRQEVVGIDQMAQAMAEINKLTTYFVVNVEQSKASSLALVKVAARLRESVSAFKL